MAGKMKLTPMKLRCSRLVLNAAPFVFLLSLWCCCITGCGKPEGSALQSPVSESPVQNSDREMAQAAPGEDLTEKANLPQDTNLLEDIGQPPTRQAEMLEADPAMESMAVRAQSANRTLAPQSTFAQESAAPQASNPGPVESLPAGSTRAAENGFATVQVFYATDRQRDGRLLSEYEVTGNRDVFLLLIAIAAIGGTLAFVQAFRRKTQFSFLFGGAAAFAGLGAIALVMTDSTEIDKSGVTYSSDRGTLVRGVCEVTVPDSHQRGVVERPSLLRFEVREDQREHIVLTSAAELSPEEFQSRLSSTVATSPYEDLLVFVHGYNVDFESAVQRTAQIAVDLPFEGVPVCYSWPSQGSLLGYTIDETNAAWTQSHLKQFLLELAAESGAKSINVVAHSMGNRPTTGALAEISWKYGVNPIGQRRPDEPAALFDRVVLAAPDIDADRFRRDLVEPLTRIADHVTLYASSDDQALVASKQVHGYPRAGESGASLVVVPGIETVDVSGIDLSLLGHSYYGDNQSMLRDLYEVVRYRLPASSRKLLMAHPLGELTYWQLMQRPTPQRISAEGSTVSPVSR